MGASLNSNGAVDKHSSSPNPSSSASSIFSRIPRIPWRIRTPTRQVADFHVRPNEPHRQYAAGDHVHGAVILTVVKNLRITHLTVALHGYVRVYKGPAVAERELTTPIINGRSEAQYHGNGCASLFQDEVVLAGEGRLEAAKYQFQFDLQLPDKGLPSSIDFERGTISYMITATLTLPGPMSPTRTYDRKITLTEKIDIGTLSRPRPRTIYLEPISKKSKKRRQTGADKAPPNSDTFDHASDRESTVEQSVASEDVHHDSNELVRSPIQQDVRSEVSGDSVTSGSNLSDRGTELQSASALAANAKLQAVDEKTITATIELLKGGALAGDTSTVKISVQHIKRLKSMHGVIVTLYRQGRIDSAPPASLFADMASGEDVRKLQKDDYYPRSRTGLGGLSLSSASSQSVFRKDLSQTISPLIIDPATMETTVTASVKVPEDAFPTITNVPGDMISFKYQVEVLVDLGGRLASHLQGGNQSRGAGFGAPGGQASVDGSSYMSRGGNVIDTDRLRREKGVICVHFELVLGTVDSTRGRKPSENLRSYQFQEDAASQEEIISPWSEENAGGDDGSEYWRQPTPTRGPAVSPLSRRPTDSETVTARRPREEAPAYVPPPEITDESTLTEKERVRRQEQRLLPSQPPAGPSTETQSPGEAEAEAAGPSAPAAPAAPTTPASEPNIYDADDEPSRAATAPGAQEPTEATAVAPRAPASPLDNEAPSAPTLDDLSAGHAAGRTDDKQELERQRLLNEASAPPEFPDDSEAGPSSNGAGPSAPPVGEVSSQGAGRGDAEPSAPVLGDEDEGDYGAQYSYHAETAGGPGAGPSSSRRDHGHEPLPAYER